MYIAEQMDSVTNLDSDPKLKGYIVLCRNCSHYMDVD